jgi:hypothetical protein
MWINSKDLVGVYEVCEILNKSEGLISVWRQRGKFPEPLCKLKCGSFWTRQVIEEFKKGIPS